MADYVAKFYDAELRPPRGGWRVVIAGREFSASSEHAVRDLIKQWRMNNGTFVSDHEIVREIWDVWTANEPDREVRNFPNLAQSAVNAAFAAARVFRAVVTGEKIISPQSETQRKRAICECCTLYDISQGAENARCSHCSCPIKHKLALQTEGCPIGKF